MKEEEGGRKYMANNGFKKEYVTGHKDRWDIDYKIMMKGIDGGAGTGENSYYNL
ncbi:MAG: hypothetical protein QXU18_12005 [Thermoplasmatales archaeon]